MLCINRFGGIFWLKNSGGGIAWPVNGGRGGGMNGKFCSCSVSVPIVIASDVS